MLHALLQNHSQGNLALASTTANNAVQSEYQPWNGDELETSRAGDLVYVLISDCNLCFFVLAYAMFVLDLVLMHNQPVATKSLPL